ncbi:MAG: magnesium chelatase subunit D [Pseudomonadota bacterium]
MLRFGSIAPSPRFSDVVTPSQTPAPETRPDLAEVYAQGLAVWERAELIATLLAIDPAGLGGVRLRGTASRARDRWLEGFEALQGSDVPMVTLPAHVAEDALLGGISLERSLTTGTLVAEPGLLARADGGTLVIRLAEQVDAGHTAAIAEALDTGQVRVERQGASRQDPARFATIVLDSHAEDEDGPPFALLDRLAFSVPLDSVPARCAAPFDRSSGDIHAARAQLGTVTVAPDAVEALVRAAAQIGCPSLRAPLFALRAAKALAALDGRSAVDETDMVQAVSLTLAHRGTIDDVDPQPEPDPPPDPETPPDDPPNEDTSSTDADTGALEEQLIEAIRNAAMADALATLARGRMRPKQAKAGRSGDSARKQNNGRPDRPAPRARQRKGRVDLLATLRAAAPYQRIRRRTAKRSKGGLHLRSDDLQVKTYRHRLETAVIFVVDASGSSALNRMAEAKGAIEHLLSDCYSRRDHVALVAVRGEEADVLLAPTRALTRVRRALSALPSGGTTPLASGVRRGGELAVREARGGRSPLLVILSDGRGNVALDGSTDRLAAEADLATAARQVALDGVPAMVFDTARRPGGHAKRLADALRADYRHLPVARGETVSRAVRERIGRR